MNISKSVSFFYWIYTLYILIIINITSLEFIYILPSLILLWIMYLFFNMGNRNLIGKNIKFSSKLKMDSFFPNKNKLFLSCAAIISLSFSLLATYYYTGQTPVSIIEKLMSGSSLYLEYQLYFSQSNLSEFSLTKLPFILMLSFVKLNLFISYISFLLFKKKVEKLDYFYLFIITISQIYFSIARGTNFELFEIILLSIFILNIKARMNRKKLSALIKTFLIISIMIYAFLISISARGNEINEIVFTPDVFYNPHSIIAKNFPMITTVSANIFGYFGFGFFYTSAFFNEIWSGSLKSLIAGLMPKGYSILYNSEISEIMSNTISMGPRWHPDAANLINIFGLVGLLLFCFLLGVIAQLSLNNDIHSKNEYDFLRDFMIMLQMLSLPVGNFVVVSSANRLIILFLIIYYFWRKYMGEKKIKYRSNI